MSYQNPWEVYPHIWKTKAEFFSWLRGNLRRAVWEIYPPKIEFKNSACSKPPSDYTGRARTGAYCALTRQWTAKSSLEVDHIVGHASLTDWSDVLGFIQHLCSNHTNFQLVEKEAHKVKSYAERTGLTYEEAVIEKKAISIIKNKKDKQFFTDRGLDIPSNAKKRRTEIVDILKKETYV